MLEDGFGPQARLVEVMSGLTAQLVADSENDADSATVLARVCDAGVVLLDAAAVGVMLVDPRGGISVAAASDERARLVELLQTQMAQGPCMDCVSDKAIVEEEDLSAAQGRWPEFASAAADAGFRSVLAVPMMLDGNAVGGLNLLYTRARTFTDIHRQLGEVLARLIVLHLIRDDEARRNDRLTERILGLLHDRVQVEHAIGLIVGTLSISVPDAWDILTRVAGRRGLSLRSLAREITVDGRSPEELDAEDRRYE
ncbi:GAF and ANTAR domain-containing protein [Rhodococcoides kyotonense]|uniref:GAF domain-containing protein n=1 Tax=Rhodococcoides kyotonense TaxID=398843 RepID=A0A239MIN1_9NOCA|nr:GAF and ANTAR domain-containing protein [Rhodococcus kyotonensis]SNT42360.1 GAF domain-containing protein [Rhodococcus kyotonensis]